MGSMRRSMLRKIYRGYGVPTVKQQRKQEVKKQKRQKKETQDGHTEEAN